MAGSDGNSRYFHTADSDPERFRLRQACRIRGGQIHDEADDGLLGEIATPDAEAANFD